MPDNPIALGTQLRQRRIARGMTQQDVVDASGTSHNNLSRIENSQVLPNLATLNRLLDALECEMTLTEIGEVPALRARVADLEATLRAVQGGVDTALATENRQLRAALDALARQPVLTHDLIDQARAACTTTLIPLPERNAA
jgi:transcriptional regulator with XRE-family HTH domain